MSGRAPYYVVPARSINNIIAMDWLPCTMSAAKDPMTSLSIHRSTLENLQELKTGAETWDMFLERLAAFYEDTLTPELRSELLRRGRGPRIPLRETFRRHEEMKRRGR